MVNLAIAMPISIGAIGVGERTFVYVSTHRGLHREMAFSVSLFNLLVKLAAGLTGVAVYAVVHRT